MTDKSAATRDGLDLAGTWRIADLDAPAQVNVDQVRESAQQQWEKARRDAAFAVEAARASRERAYCELWLASEALFWRQVESMALFHLQPEGAS